MTLSNPYIESTTALSDILVLKNRNIVLSCGGKKRQQPENEGFINIHRVRNEGNQQSPGKHTWDL